MSKIAVIGIVGKTIFMEVEAFHKGGETIETEKAHFEYGAKGFNQALAAVRMGADVSFLCPVGDDYYEDILKLCEGEGISPYIVKKDCPTSFGCVITNAEGANHVTVFKGASLSAEDIVCFEEEIRTADILLLTNEIGEDVNLAAVKLAKKYGTKIILNPAPTRATSKEILDAVYLFTPNEFEICGLENYTNVIQTMGDKGCYIRSTGTMIPATKVKAVDTTGAGDCFNGTLAAELAFGKELSDAAKTAVRASGISVTRRGAATSIPFRDEIFK